MEEKKHNLSGHMIHPEKDRLLATQAHDNDASVSPSTSNQKRYGAIAVTNEFNGEERLGYNKLAGPIESSIIKMRILKCSLITLSFLAVASVAWSLFTPIHLLHPRQLQAPSPPDFLNPVIPQNIATYDSDTWTLKTHTFVQNHFQVQPYVANGYHGLRLPAEGIGYWMERNISGSHQPLNGWPLYNPRQTVATISGFWDSQHNTTGTNFPELLKDGGESVIAGIPIWSTILLTTPMGHTYGPGVNSSTVKDYTQSLSLRNGVVTTTLKWTPEPEGPCFSLEYTVVAHRSRLNLGIVKVDITSSEDTKLTVTDVLDGQGAQRTSFGSKGYMNDGTTIWTSVKPDGLSNVTAYEFSTIEFPGMEPQALATVRSNAEFRPYVSVNQSTAAQEWVLNLKAGSKVTVIKYVGIASSDAFPGDTLYRAQSTSECAKRDGWNKLIQEHNQAWHELWQSDIVVPGDQELQISLRASLYHLLANVRGGSEGAGIGDNSISVGGLASDSYAGFVFWDADLWMYPGLLALNPDHASSINNYRFKLLSQARENAKKYGQAGALFPWTSGRFGNCTGTGPCKDYQYHLNNDIVHSHWNYYLSTGDKRWLKEKGWPVIKAVAEMWEGKVVKNATTQGQYWLFNMTDPDEYANHVNNGAFTNAGIIVTMEIAMKAAQIVGEGYSAKWNDIMENMAVPYDYEANIIVEFQGMNGSVEIKQADVVLMNYPLEWRFNESQALNDMNFYARAQSQDGPAMTWAIFSINSAELEPYGCSSYSYMLYGSQPYLREPYYQFSEQIIDDVYTNGGTNPAFTFLTGHGGFLQVATHGYTGFRLRQDVFHLDPSLPPQIKEGLQVKGMHWQGAIFDIYIGLESTTIHRRKTGNKKKDQVPKKVEIASRNPKAGVYSLKADQKLIVPTRRPDLNGTWIKDNLAQCKPTIGSSPHVPGHYPLSAVDGSNATVWQPASDAPAFITVDLGEVMPLRGAELNWAHIPPNKFTILATSKNPDESNEGWVQVYSTDKVPITDPWDPDDVLVIRNRIGNTTSVPSFGKKFHGRWVRLVIEGSKAYKKGVGAQVAEFAILS